MNNQLHEWEASTLSANAPDFTDGEALLNNPTLPNTSSWLASLNYSIKSTLLQSNWVLKK